MNTKRILYRYSIILISVVILLATAGCDDSHDIYVYNDSDDVIWVDYCDNEFKTPSISEYSNFKDCASRSFTVFGKIHYELKKNFECDTVVIYVISDEVYGKYTIEHILTEKMYETDTISGSELMRRDFLVTYPFK